MFSPQTVPFGGTCADQTGVNGNTSADPVFFRESRGDVPGDCHLQQTSPAVDAGDNAAPQIPTLDLDGAAPNEAIDATDWRITGDMTVNLRADRSKKGTGRTYTITIECVDASGNVSTKKATVTVPR